MHALLAMIQNTPTYVWFIFGYLLFIGVRATKTRTVHLPKLFIVPGILIARTISSLVMKQDLYGIGLYALAAIIGIFLGNFTLRSCTIQAHKGTKSIAVPGSYGTLVFIFVIFSIRYFFGFMHATHPEQALAYTNIETIVYGLLCGTFIGRLSCYVRAYLKA